ncbi:nucleotide-diphospho-sugar transferase [Pilobolus umbonatus]|nr:nucleotide-diphospho-sugar transferase [Pilobolus umbonatus]
MARNPPLISDYPETIKQTTPIREKAAFVMLARNDDLEGARYAIQQLEDRFNHQYNYPYVFLNDEEFDQEFVEYTSGLVSGESHYGLVGSNTWGYPDWVDLEKAAEGREKLMKEDVPYAEVESYRHMCRFQSGYFFRHPLLDEYDYYWRVEPDVRFSCDIDYDPFKVMRERDLKYGFTLSLYEYEQTIPTLWDTVNQFVKEFPEHVIPFNSSDSLIEWVTEDEGETYNLCHFWSNFEIGSLNWLRSKQYLDYFEFLDKTGGFFYERWGDAPVHSLAVALMLKQSEVHFFYDIGYFHDPFLHCPDEPSWLPIEKCNCNPHENSDDEDYSCTSRFLEVTNKEKSDFLITQRGPRKYTK